ncbi:MAG: hypothetical protein M1831_000160 [Alyxoria varia]|nr:MAG: hypothetical protein M1831_000160 [Alyxoria varia]
MSPRHPSSSRKSSRDKDFDPAYDSLPPQSFPKYDQGYVPVRGMIRDDLRQPPSRSRSHPRHSDPRDESQRRRSGYQVKMYGPGNTEHSNPERKASTYDRFREEHGERQHHYHQRHEDHGELHDYYPRDSHFAATNRRYHEKERAAVAYQKDVIDPYKAREPAPNPVELKSYRGKQPSAEWWHQGMEKRNHQLGRMHEDVATDREAMGESYIGYEPKEKRAGHKTQVNDKRGAAKNSFKQANFHRDQRYDGN